jgi:hypothetical protein
MGHEGADLIQLAQNRQNLAGSYEHFSELSSSI